MKRAAVIDADTLDRLPLAAVEQVTFFKRDELTTDLICCEIVSRDRSQTFHEELRGWPSLIEHLQGLPGFRRDWFAGVSQPPFAISEFIAFKRSSPSEPR
jgi:hypothetical protein